MAGIWARRDLTHVVAMPRTAHVGPLSTGIGVGNPGGGTFHAVVFKHQNGHAFSLTSEPFEQVPQGGPDLTADESALLPVAVGCGGLDSTGVADH
ncbi:hypothetical protein [Micromonospora sp. L32]|uniref:hypothetical protein n=1 Tax=Micromonospora TaxID=1873 RepID=UPI003F8BA4E8